MIGVCQNLDVCVSADLFRSRFELHGTARCKNLEKNSITEKALDL